VASEGWTTQTGGKWVDGSAGKDGRSRVQQTSLPLRLQQVDVRAPGVAPPTMTSGTNV